MKWRYNAHIFSLKSLKLIAWEHDINIDDTLHREGKKSVISLQEIVRPLKQDCW